MNTLDRAANQLADVVISRLQQLELKLSPPNIIKMCGDPLLTVQAISLFMNRSETTVYNMMNKGLVSERNGNGIRRVRLSELNNYLGRVGKQEQK
jgi:hypothetical protein